MITIVHFSDRIRCSDRSFICTYVHFFVEGRPLTLIHTVNAAKSSFPTSIVGIVFTCFGWVGQGSPKKEGFKAYKFLQWWQHKHGRGSKIFVGCNEGKRSSVPRKL